MQAWDYHRSESCSHLLSGDTHRVFPGVGARQDTGTRGRPSAQPDPRHVAAGSSFFWLVWLSWQLCLDLCGVHSEAGEWRGDQIGPPGRGTCRNQGSGASSHWATEHKAAGWLGSTGAPRFPLGDPSLTPVGASCGYCSPVLGQ